MTSINISRIKPGCLFALIGSPNRIFLRLLAYDDSIVSPPLDAKANVPAACLKTADGESVYRGSVYFFENDTQVIPLEIDLFDGDDLVGSSYQI